MVLQFYAYIVANAGNLLLDLGNFEDNLGHFREFAFGKICWKKPWNFEDQF